MKKLIKYHNEYLIVQDLYRNDGDDISQFIDREIVVNTSGFSGNALNVITHSTMDIPGAIKIKKEKVLQALGGRADNIEHDIYIVYGELLIL